MTIMKKNAGMLGLMALMMAGLDENNLGEPKQSKREREMDRSENLTQWAKEKLEAERLQKIKSKRKKLMNPPKKTKKHTFKVEYSKGKKPKFK